MATTGALLVSVVLVVAALAGTFGDVGRWLVAGIVAFFWLIWAADVIRGGGAFSREFRRGWRREA